MDIPTLIRRAAREHGAATAVVCGDESLTFVDFDERTERLANAFHAEGLRPGDVVALLLPNGIDLVVAYYALAKAGLVRLGLNFRDTEDDQVYKLQDSGARALLSEQPLPGVEMTFDSSAVRSLSLSGDPDQVTHRWADEDLLRIGYTGGTTGRPKGVLLTHGIEMALLRNYLLDLIPGTAPGDVMLHAAPMTHASGSFFLTNLVRGACNVVMERFEPQAYLDLLDRTEAACTFLVPTMISMLVDHPGADDREHRSLRHLCYGASPIAPTVVARAERLFGQVLTQTYGQAETPMSITLLRPEEHDRVGSAGRPYTFVDVQVHDEVGRAVPTGSEGEVVVRADTVTPGYLNRPDATAETLRGGWLHTGDIGRFDDEGHLYLLDRMNDTIISGGFNVYPREVEDLLMSHPAVTGAAAFGLKNERWGEVVHAAVTVSQPVDEADLVAFARDRLADYKRPRGVTVLEELPKSAAGKILRRVVRDDMAT